MRRFNVFNFIKWAENKRMPIVDGKKFVISDSTKKKKP